jgi:hypothetical protein
MDFQSLAVTDAEFGSINSLIKELRTKIVNWFLNSIYLNLKDII